MKLRIVFSIAVLLLINAVAYGQNLPCGGTDPDATCPLDSWVIVLAVAASFFAAFSLYRRQKALQSRAK